MRPAFSMLTAIFVLIVMASLGAFVLSLSSKTVKITTAQYQHEQAELYAKSYTEYAILAVTGNDRNTTCLQTIKATIKANPDSALSVDDGNGYRVRTHIAYIGPTAEIGNCPAVRRLSTNVTTTATPLTVIIDAYVDYKDPDNPDGNFFTVHRRTVQKI
jgi:hypothetical protein